MTIFSNPDFIYNDLDAMVSDLVNNQFYLPLTITKLHLSNYYLLHWEGTHITDQILRSPLVYGQETITREQIVYLVKFDGGLSAFSLNQNQKQQYKLSFRRAKSDVFGTVLIREIL